MLTIIDLGHKPRSSCYLIELDLYPDSEHKAIHILVDAPIEISDILDFVPNEIHCNTKQSQTKSNWKLDESGKQWIIGNKPFKDSPFYCTVPFQTTLIKNTKSNIVNKDRKNTNAHTNTKKRKLFKQDKDDENNNNSCDTLPLSLRQSQIFVDVILISNHESILGLPYLFKTKRCNKQNKTSISYDLNNMDKQTNMNNLLESLLSTDAITMNDIFMNEMEQDNIKDNNTEQKMDIDNNNNNCIEIVMAAHCNIYATAPTKQYGKLLMKSLASSQNEYFVLNKNKSVDKHKNDNILYDIELIEECIDSIIPCQYNETLSIIGSGHELEIICISSGLYIGSSNWIIHGLSMDISIGIVMGSCGATNRHPKSITLSPHFDIIGNIDLVLIDDLQSILLNDESANDSLLLMEKKIIETISMKGSIIMPCIGCGIAYDMLERIHLMLNKYDYSYIQIYFISSIAKESISYSSIYGEYLHQNNMKHVSDAKYPFGFQTYILHNRLIHCTQWNNKFCFKYIKSNLSESRIIICESPSLRYGNILHLLQIFNHPKNTLILTDPHFIPHLALYPFTNITNTTNKTDINIHNIHNSTMKDESKSANENDMIFEGLKLQIVSYPIDARLQIKELCVLLRKVCPKYAFIPNNYYKRIMQNMNKFININTLQLNKQKQSQNDKNKKSQPQQLQHLISPILLEKIKNIQYFTMNSGAYHCITFNNTNDNNSNQKRVYIDSLISQNIYPKNINPNHSNNMFIASLNGTIDYNTNKNKLILRNKDFINQKSIINKTFIGTLNIDGLINNLKINTHITSINQTETNTISFYITDKKNNKQIKIKVLTSDNITNIRCNSPLNKQTLTHILDIVSRHLVSF